MQHAVISAENGHFYPHHRIDWDQVEKVVEEIGETGHIRAASTITHQIFMCADDVK